MRKVHKEFSPVVLKNVSSLAKVAISCFSSLYPKEVTALLFRMLIKIGV